VNTFFFSSLIFSTASAVQSMLAMTWLRPFVRLPERHLPRLVFAWLTKGPTLSLFITGAFFSMGLILFVFSSMQDAVTSSFTAFFASIHALGVLFLAVWFHYERWQFRIQAGITGRKLTKNSIILDSVEIVLKFLAILRTMVQPIFGLRNNRTSPQKAGPTSNVQDKLASDPSLFQESAAEVQVSQTRKGSSTTDHGAEIIASQHYSSPSLVENDPAYSRNHAASLEPSQSEGQYLPPENVTQASPISGAWVGWDDPGQILLQTGRTATFDFPPGFVPTGILPDASAEIYEEMGNLRRSEAQAVGTYELGLQIERPSIRPSFRDTGVFPSRPDNGGENHGAGSGSTSTRSTSVDTESLTNSAYDITIEPPSTPGSLSDSLELGETIFTTVDIDFLPSESDIQFNSFDPPEDLSIFGTMIVDAPLDMDAEDIDFPPSGDPQSIRSMLGTTIVDEPLSMSPEVPSQPSEPTIQYMTVPPDFQTSRRRARHVTTYRGDWVEVQDDLLGPGANERLFSISQIELDEPGENI